VRRPFGPNGALVEKLLRTPVKVVVQERLHELLHATIPVIVTPVTADLTVAAATGFAVWKHAGSRSGRSHARCPSRRHRPDGKRRTPALRTEGPRAQEFCGVHRRLRVGVLTEVARDERLVDRLAEVRLIRAWASKSVIEAGVQLDHQRNVY
jgi:hypothetical protein